MADVQLKLVKKTNDGVFGKAINNFNKILYSPSSSFFNIAINSKRNTVVKNFLLSESYEKNVNEKKKNHFMSKYEKNYETYLGMLENYVTDTVYNKVKKEVSSLKENQLLSSYYELIALKSTDFVEYKYRRQTLLLAMDWDNVISNKSNAFVEKYKKFYLSVCEQLYKALADAHGIANGERGPYTTQEYDQLKTIRKFGTVASDAEGGVPNMTRTTGASSKLISNYVSNYKQQ